MTTKIELTSFPVEIHRKMMSQSTHNPSPLPQEWRDKDFESGMYRAAARGNSALETLSAVTVEQAAKLDVLSTKSERLVRRLRNLQTMMAGVHGSQSDVDTSHAHVHAHIHIHTASSPSPSKLQNQIESEVRVATAEAEALCWMLAIGGESSSNSRSHSSSNSHAKIKAAKEDLHSLAHRCDIAIRARDQSVNQSLQEAQAASESLKALQAQLSTRACASTSGVDSAASTPASQVFPHSDWSELQPRSPHPSNAGSAHSGADTWGTAASQPESHYDADCCGASQSSGVDSLEHCPTIEENGAPHDLSDNGPYATGDYASLALDTVDSSSTTQGDDSDCSASSCASEDGDNNAELVCSLLEDEGGPEEWFRSTMRTRSACTKKLRCGPRFTHSNGDEESAEESIPAANNPLWGTESRSSEINFDYITSTTAPEDLRTHSASSAGSAQLNRGVSKIPSIHGPNSPAPSPGPASPSPSPISLSPSPRLVRSACSSPSSTRPIRSGFVTHKTRMAPERLTLYERACLRSSVDMSKQHSATSPAMQLSTKWCP